MFVRLDSEEQGIGIRFVVVYKSSQIVKDNSIPFVMVRGGHMHTTLYIPLLYAHIA